MMFKQYLLAGAALAVLTGAAAAADLPSRRAPPVYVPPPVPAFTWTGVYIGANAGYSFSDGQTIRTVGNNGAGAMPLDAPFFTDTVNNVAIGRRPASISGRGQGFTGGGQIGYNYQIAPGPSVVLGIEADAAYTDQRRTSNFLSALNDPSTFRQRLDFLGTVRGRIGYAFDRVFIYGTGGLAYGNVSYNVQFFGNAAAQPLAYAGAYNGLQTGYVFGGGVEYALPTTSFLNVFGSSAVTLKAEFLHYDLGSRNVLVNFTGNAPANGSYTSRFHTQGNVARAGLNFKFGSPVAPVVARY